MTTISSPWFVQPRPNPQAKLTLFCFPYAGTGAVVYRKWPDDLPSEIEVCSILLPGRETRLRAELYVSIHPLLDALITEITPLLDRPYAFYGHSLGALLAFELTRRLRRQSTRLPIHLFLSGRRAPGLPDTQHPIHKLDNNAFAEAIQERYNGIPQVILEDAELLDIFLPILKADISILETYEYIPENALDIPISVFGGEQDPVASFQELQAWQKLTTRDFDIRVFPGNHFFIQEQRTELLQAISTVLKPYISR